MAEFDPGPGFERQDGYEPSKHAPFVYMEVQGDQGRVLWRTVRGALGEPLAAGHFGESHWMPANDAVKFAMGGAGILDQTPVPYKVVGW